MRDLLNSFKGDNQGSFRGDVMAPLLNADTSPFFLARVERAHGGPLLFEGSIPKSARARSCTER